MENIHFNGLGLYACRKCPQIPLFTAKYGEVMGWFFENGMSPTPRNTVVSLFSEAPGIEFLSLVPHPNHLVDQNPPNVTQVYCLGCHSMLGMLQLAVPEINFLQTFAIYRDEVLHVGDRPMMDLLVAGPNMVVVEPEMIDLEGVAPHPSPMHGASYENDLSSSENDDATLIQGHDTGSNFKQSRLNNVCHSATIYANAIMHAVDMFLRENLDWLSRATNCAKFGATAGLGVIHRRHLQQGRSLMAPYLPQGSPCSEGGALYALGLIHANHGEGIGSFPHTVPSNPSSAMSSMSNFGIMEGFGSHTHIPNGNRRAGELKRVFGSYQNSWNSPSTYQQLSSSPLTLRNSPSFVNGLHERRFARNSSLWERLAYSPRNSALPVGSHGSPGFPSSPQLHFMDIAPQKMFSQTTDMTINAAHSPRHLFTGRNPISMPTSFDSLRESARNLSHRRSEANSNNMDKRQYDLDVERILRGDDKRTTLMIKNIPNKYAAIDEYCRGTYDFLCLPIDFKNKCNVGYAFINMIDPRQIIPFHQAFNGKKWEKFNSEKVATLAYARIQGITALIAHFQNSSLMNEDKRCRPILFHTDGPNAGDPEPFPMGTSIRSRPGRSRASGNEEENSSAFESMASSLKDSD